MINKKCKHKDTGAEGIIKNELKGTDKFPDQWVSIEVGLPNDNVEVKVKVDCNHNGNGTFEPKHNAKYNHICKQWESGLSTLYFVTHWKQISTAED